MLAIRPPIDFPPTMTFAAAAMLLDDAAGTCRAAPAAGPARRACLDVRRAAMYGNSKRTTRMPALRQPARDDVHERRVHRAAGAVGEEEDVGGVVRVRR